MDAEITVGSVELVVPLRTADEPLQGRGVELLAGPRHRWLWQRLVITLLIKAVTLAPIHQGVAALTELVNDILAGRLVGVEHLCAIRLGAAAMCAEGRIDDDDAVRGDGDFLSRCWD